MLGFGPISSSAISALPDYLTNTLSVSFAGVVTYEATAFSPYEALVNTSGQRICYAVKLNFRAVR
jgi:hypothetical protein